MKRWLAGLVLCFTGAASGAEDLGSAARELGRKTAALGNVAVSWRNVSSLGSRELAAARTAFEAELAAAGGRATGQVAVRVTLSETPAQYMLVEETPNGVWMAAWARSGPVKVVGPGVSLDRKLVWEQDEPILDVAFPANGGVLVLTPGRVILNGASRPLGKTLARDARGRLRLSGSGFEVFLPETKCTGTTEPFAMSCQTSDEPWVLESGSRALLLANFAAGRNFFDGRVVMQTGTRKTVAPFYSAAAAEEQGRPLWLAAMVDGRVQMFSGGLDPVTSFTGWGSDVAGTSARCGGGTQIVATRPGYDADAVQAFGVVERAPLPLTAALAMNGPVTALWPSGSEAVVAVVHDAASGKYAAYLITVVCGG